MSPLTPDDPLALLFSVGYEQSPCFLSDSRVSEQRARVKITHPRKARRVLLFSRGVTFTRARVLLALLSLRKNGDYS